MALNSKLEGIFDSYLTGLNLHQNRWIQGLNGSAMSFFIHSLFKNNHKSLVMVCADKEKAAYLLNDLETLLPDDLYAGQAGKIFFSWTSESSVHAHSDRDILGNTYSHKAWGLNAKIGERKLKAERGI